MNKAIELPLKFRDIDETLSGFKGLYAPDYWTFAIVNACIESRQFSEQVSSVLEVGCGTGALTILLNRCAGLDARRYCGVDINPDAIKATETNFGKFLGQSEISVRLLDITKAGEQAAQRTHDYVFANIPQMPLSKSPIRGVDPADYYELNENSRNDLIDQFGLGLLRQFIYHCDHGPDGHKPTLLFTEAGRPPRSLLDQMFFKNPDYDAELIYQSRVPQDPGTSIACLAEAEQDHGLACQFWADKQSNLILSAAEAHQRMLSNHTVYHDLNVIKLRRR